MYRNEVMSYMTFEQELMRTRSAYFLDGWLKFNEEMWGYKAERVMYTLPGKDKPALEGVLYLTKNGKVRQPPLNAYLPLQFYPTPTEKNCQLYTQWMSVAKLLAEDIKKRGLVGNISFPPGFIDARCFQWLGFDVTLRYTFVVELPYAEEILDASVRNKIKKAIKAGYTIEHSYSWNDVVYGLQKTASFKKFDKLWTPEMLKRCSNILDKYLLAYVAKSLDGTPVAAQIKLILPGGLCACIGAGTDRMHINSGVNQLLYYESIKAVIAAGTKYFDFCGANIEQVARAKAAWGFPLVPYMSLVDNSLPQLIKRNVAARIPMARTAYHKLRRTLHNGN